MTASDSESRIAVGNCWLGAFGRLSGWSAMLSGVPFEGGQEERCQHAAHAAGGGLAIEGGQKWGGGRYPLGVPTQMLARHAHAGLLAIVRQHRFEMAADHAVLFGKRGFGQALAGP